MSATAPLLEVEELVVAYGAAVALDGVSIRVEAGERVALIGPNGAGKTTLLNAISGVVRPRAGRVRVDGGDVTGRPPAELVALGVSQAPEGRHVFPTLSVEANLQLGALGRELRGRVLPRVGRIGADRRARRARLQRMYELLPQLHELRDRPAARISGGEQQMVAIARALMAAPRLLAVDELSLGLAPLVVESLVVFLRDLNERDGVALLVVEQQAETALELCERAYVLDAGRCDLSGASDAVAVHPLVRAAYLGEAAEADAL